MSGGTGRRIGEDEAMRYMLLQSYGAAGADCPPMTQWTPADIKGATEEALSGGTVIKDDPFGKIVRGKAARRGQSVVIDVTLDSSGSISTTYPAWNQ